jgi:hypothetical protein
MNRRRVLKVHAEMILRSVCNTSFNVLAHLQNSLWRENAYISLPEPVNIIFSEDLKDLTNILQKSSTLMTVQ